MKKYFLQIIAMAMLIVPQIGLAQSIKYRVIEKGEKKEASVSSFDLTKWDFEKKKTEKEKNPPKLIFEKKEKYQKDSKKTQLFQEQDEEKEETPLKTVQEAKEKKELNLKLSPDWKPSPIEPQLASPPAGREPHDDEFFYNIIEANMDAAWAIKHPINGIDFYGFLKEKLYREYENGKWEHIEFEEFCDRERLRFMSMHQIFRFAYYNVENYERIIKKASRDYGVPVYIIKSIIVQESQGKNEVQSWKGAKGLMQLMDTTGAIFGVEDPYDPVQNIRAGTLHFKGLMIQFDGDLELAIAAYNAGGTRVQKYGIPDYPETQNYVARVSDYIELYKQIY